jgi:hypothetical protein
MPLRSAPDEAAVAEVLGTLSVLVGEILIRLEIDLEHLGDHLATLTIEPLAHLGAAVVEQDRAVGIDMHQGAGLVEVGGGEGDAELHRRQREAALEQRAAALKAAIAARRAW